MREKYELQLTIFCKNNEEGSKNIIIKNIQIKFIKNKFLNGIPFIVNCM